MSQKRSKRLLILSAAVAGVGLFATKSKADLTWDSSGANPTLASGGSGTWDYSLPLWSNGSSDVVWDQTGAIFGSGIGFGDTGGTITVSTGTGVVTTGLTFNQTSDNSTFTFNGSNAGDTIKIGSGGINASALNSGVTTINNGVALSASQNWNVGGGAALLVGGAINNGGNTITFTGAGNTTINGVISGGGGISKTNASTLTLGAANNYSGQTLIQAGTLKIGITNALPTNGAVVMGVSGGAAGVGSNVALDLTGFDQTIGSLTGNMTTSLGTLGNETPAETITISSGNTLTVNGNVRFGPSTTDAINRQTVRFAGGGSLVVNDNGTADNNGAFTFAIGNPVGPLPANGSTTTMDLRSLSNFTVTAGAFRIGNNNSYNSENNSDSSIPGSLVMLAPTSSITAGKLIIESGTGSRTETLRLGSVANTINTDRLGIGGGGTDTGEEATNNTRANGTLNFVSSTGTVTMRGQAGGTSRVAVFNMIVSATEASTSNVITSIVDFSNHTADLRIGSLVMASRGSQGIGGQSNATFSVGGTSGAGALSVVDISSILMANRFVGNTGTGAALTYAGLANATVNLNGGTTTVGTISMAQNTSTDTTQASLAVLNIKSGSVSIGSMTNVANATAGNTSSSLINVTGGNVTLSGDIKRTGGAGSENTTLTLNGSTALLDMTGHSIGTAAAPIGSGTGSLNFMAGQLQNVLEINGGAGLLKKDSGNAANTLVLAGTSSYTGGTTVNAGILSVSADANLGNVSGGVTINNATLLSTGSFTTARSVNLNNAGSVIDATGANTLVLTGTVTDVGTVTKGTNSGTVQFGQAAGYTTAGSVNVNGGKLAFGDSVNGVTGPVSIGGTLTVNDGTLVSFLPATGTAITHSISALNLNTAGKLDVGNSSFLTNSNVQPYLAAGFNGGAWNGTGAAIVSSSAASSTNTRGLGFATAADQAAGRVSATVAPLAAGQTLVKYTTPGDADLSGGTNFNDFLALQNNFNKAGNWTQGDFDYNGTTNFNDFLILQNNFNKNLNANGTVAHSAVSKLTASPAAAAPSVTYVLSANDDGHGNVTPGKYAVYAIDSTADGNKGVAAFSVDVQGFTLVTNFSPKGTYDKGQGNGSSVVEGFTLLRSVNGAFSTGSDPVKASQDTVDDQSGVVLIYGMGQTGGNLNTAAPAGSSGGTGKTQPVYTSPLVIATGTFTSGLAFNSDQTFDKANVFLTNTAGDTEAAGIVMVTQDLSGVPEPTTLGLVALAAGGLVGRRKRRK